MNLKLFMSSSNAIEREPVTKHQCFTCDLGIWLGDVGKTEESHRPSFMPVSSSENGTRSYPSVSIQHTFSIEQILYR